MHVPWYVFNVFYQWWKSIYWLSVALVGALSPPAHAHSSDPLTPSHIYSPSIKHSLIYLYVIDTNWNTPGGLGELLSLILFTSPLVDISVPTSIDSVNSGHVYSHHRMSQQLPGHAISTVWLFTWLQSGISPSPWSTFSISVWEAVAYGL
jgi:hypothetical protein